ncbi:SLC29A2 [Branchiostoma lanceolatum]|uniref:SLC29A2 protein n=1 Tax=Branchiostoma lanceolatum TaxID=7740 RepID=A0A8J9ZSS0_BRALA|nr:SLC29A2 [Branchiostoma lanceolatum]
MLGWTAESVTWDHGTQPEEGQALIAVDGRDMERRQPADGMEDVLVPGARPPKDRYNAVYIIFFMLGLGMLLPWNIFITANMYFRNRFAKSSYEDTFENYFSVASMVPNVVFQLLNIFVAHKVSLNLRMVVPLVTMLVCFIVTAIMVWVRDISTIGFFLITIFTVVVINRRCTVVLDREQYDRKIQDLLGDKDTYKPLKRDPTTKFKREIIEALKKLETDEALDHVTYLKIKPKSEQPPAFYGLPKIHKQDVPLRPIVSGIGSVTYGVASFLAKILGPLVGKSQHHVQNSADFVNKIKDIRLDEDDIITSYDVCSLFTCIPPKEAVSVVREALEADNTLADRTKLSVDQICKLLDLCLGCTYFTYKGQFFQQLHGCAMGSPVSPIVVNLYMEKFENKALSTFKDTPPANWFRYVDDTWCRLKKRVADDFFEHINQIDDNIKFTQESSQDNMLPFLDTKTIIEKDGRLQFEVYRKPTHTDQYLAFDSHHPLEHKLAVIKTLFHRADNIITSDTAKTDEHRHLRGALGKCGYQRWTFNKALKPSDKSKKTPKCTPLTNRNKANITIPYVQGVSEKLRRIFQNFNIATNFKPQSTLRQRLVHPKDRPRKGSKADVIYRLKCEEPNCNNTYIGETSRSLNERYKEHCANRYSSAIFHHLKHNQGHSFNLESTDILDREPRWFELASAIMQGGSFGVAGKFPGRYTQAIMSGQALAGVFSALASILSLAAGGDPTHSGFGYFLTAVAAIVVAMVSYLLLNKFEYARFYLQNTQELPSLSEDVSSPSVNGAVPADVSNLTGSGAENMAVISRSSYLQIFRKASIWMPAVSVMFTFLIWMPAVSVTYTFLIWMPAVSVTYTFLIWMPAVSVMFTFLVTLSVFPSVSSLIESVSKSDGSRWTGEFFIPVTCFLFFNLSDLAGRVIAGAVQFPKEKSVLLPILVLLRTGFMPLFMFCNAQPEEFTRHLPVVFNSDAYPIVFMVLMGVSNGYLGSLCMMYGPSVKRIPGQPLYDVRTKVRLRSTYTERTSVFKVVFNSDAYPIVFMVLMGVSNGYLGSLCMMYGPRLVAAEDAETAGITMSAFLTLGLGLGAAFSFALTASI